MGFQSAWGFHVVHHTSEEFNYTAGTRITIFQAVVRTAFWAVLPVLYFSTLQKQYLHTIYGR